MLRTLSYTLIFIWSYVLLQKSVYDRSGVVLSSSSDQKTTLLSLHLLLIVHFIFLPDPIIHSSLHFIFQFVGQYDCGDPDYPHRSLTMDEASAYLTVCQSVIKVSGLLGGGLCTVIMSRGQILQIKAS